MRIFLGGTVNSDWRYFMINELNKLGVDYFNPIVTNWDREAQKNEEVEKEKCDWLLFVITPKMEGFYSIAEVVDASNKSPNKTIFTVLNVDDVGGLNGYKCKYKWEHSQENSIKAIKELVKKNGAHVFDNFIDTLEFIKSTCCPLPKVKLEFDASEADIQLLKDKMDKSTEKNTIIMDYGADNEKGTSRKDSRMDK